MSRIGGFRASVVCILVLLVCVCGCGCGADRQSERKTITVSILPLKFLVENIVGEDFEIEVLVPPGASPETYEPTVSQMVAIENSECVFAVGLIDFERQLIDKVTAQGSGNKIVELSEGVRLLHGDCGHSHAGGAGHGIDPHIWTAPRELGVMAANVYREIALLYPDSTKYETNFQRLAARIDSIDQVVNQIISASSTKVFVIYHPALTYFAADYGLEQISLEEEGKEPSASHLKEVIVKAKAAGVTKIFYQSQFSRSVVETVARDMGVSAVMIDPLREDVDRNIVEMAKLISGQ